MRPLKQFFLPPPKNRYHATYSYREYPKILDQSLISQIHLWNKSKI
ncbi:hypothetical protein AVDCRST_MAG84-328 [uncultured Microcoleus sp.]|uniref:Uncharacterized protein n=1 Tax=uncultured Microcoleus sp. TaxID=259945 RepID=A0A6J4KFF0_9CYAN|nr:hypothetical protein AVDCRST_MAG84-328 [uncultured Microcoleus sp.]